MSFKTCRHVSGEPGITQEHALVATDNSVMSTSLLDPKLIAWEALKDRGRLQTTVKAPPCDPGLPVGLQDQAA